jgi:hypothetical protein
VPLNPKLKKPKSGPLLPGFILNLGQIGWHLNVSNDAKVEEITRKWRVSTLPEPVYEAVSGDTNLAKEAHMADLNKSSKTINAEDGIGATKKCLSDRALYL